MVELVVSVLDALAVGVFRPILPYGQIPGIPGVPYLSRRQNASEYDEERFLVIGKIEEKLWSGVITYRNKNIRIISVRRSREEEIELYESI